MELEDLDVVAILPPELHRSAIELSGQLAGRMRAGGTRSHFLLGEQFTPGRGGVCEPHVSIFMLAVPHDRIDDVVRATREVAAGIPALAAEGEEYRHNPVGAPELYFRRTEEWLALQRAVIAEVEPLRDGRLRDVDPAGDRIRDLVADPAQDPLRRDQLTRFGYDEVGERFNPHVTMAWPDNREFRVDLTGLPPAGEFSGLLAELAVYGMSPFGTCTTDYGTAPLGKRADTPFGLHTLTPDGK
jgi:hypothetical protein